MTDQIVTGAGKFPRVNATKRAFRVATGFALFAVLTGNSPPTAHPDGIALLQSLAALAVLFVCVPIFAIVASILLSGDYGHD